MEKSTILTIAVPTFNMEKWLDKNLATYVDPQLENRLEVICLNNASEDRSREIMEKYVSRHPSIFKLIDRDSRGYGSSINAAIKAATGRYFRIVDADDWVDTQELVKLVNALETCQADVVITDHQVVNMQDYSMTPVTSAQKGIPYETLFHDLQACKTILPTIHGTTFQTSVLRESGFYMQDKIFFVDEEYNILPYLYVKTAICYPFDVYRYQVANPSQSTSPKNRAKLLKNREQVLRRLIPAYQQAAAQDFPKESLDYCFTRIEKGIGDHFTTFYMYVEDRNEGRKLAEAWKAYIMQEAPEFWSGVKRKQQLLKLLNCLHVSLDQYETLKKKFL